MKIRTAKEQAAYEKKRAYHKVWVVKNKERVSARRKQRYAENEELRKKNAERSKKWSDANREHCLSVSRAYYADHKSDAQERMRKWYQENKERLIPIFRERGATWRRKNPGYYMENREARSEKKAFARETLVDWYVRLTLRSKGLPTVEFPDDLVKLKRAQLQIMRDTRQLIATIKEKQNATK